MYVCVCVCLCVHVSTMSRIQLITHYREQQPTWHAHVYISISTYIRSLQHYLLLWIKWLQVCRPVVIFKTACVHQLRVNCTHPDIYTGNMLMMLNTTDSTLHTCLLGKCMRAGCFRTFNTAAFKGLKVERMVIGSVVTSLCTHVPLRHECIHTHLPIHIDLLITEVWPVLLDLDNT